jgi:polyisoprenoid-binding protein YceI
MTKTKWLLDLAHSEIYFKVKHLMITTVTGYFREFTVEAFTVDEDLGTIDHISFTAALDSVDTNNSQRDAHLKSADFFNVTDNKQIIFLSSKYEAAGNEGKLYGNLTIRGITKPIIVNVEVGGTVIDGYGQTKAGFTVSGKLSRKEFGLTWGAVTETGSIVVSDEVRFQGEIQLIKQV